MATSGFVSLEYFSTPRFLFARTGLCRRRPRGPAAGRGRQRATSLADKLRRRPRSDADEFNERWAEVVGVTRDTRNSEGAPGEVMLRKAPPAW